MNRQQRRALERQGIDPDAVPEIGGRRIRPKGGVCVAVVQSNMTHTRFTNCLDDLREYDRTEGSGHIAWRISYLSGPLLSAARNAVMEQFLDTECEWVWCLDDDMLCRVDALEQTMELADATERPIVGGVYYGGGQGAEIRPHVFIVRKDLDGHPYTEVRDEFPRDRPFEVDACGTGALLIHRSVIEKIGEAMRGRTAYPWFAETESRVRLEVGEDAKPIGYGEDVTFGLRARQFGFSIWMDARIWWGHIKPYVIDEHAYLAQRAFIAAHEEQAREMEPA